MSNHIVTQLKDVGFITGGGTPSTNNDSFWDGDIIWITPADMSKKYKYISSSSRKITKLGLEQSSAKLIKKNSIILSSRAPIGYLSINLVAVTTSQGCKSFTPYSENIIDIEYAYYYLLANVNELEKAGSGTTFKEISGRQFGLFKLILYPKSIQKTIVKKINSLFKKIENFI